MFNKWWSPQSLQQIFLTLRDEDSHSWDKNSGEGRLHSKEHKKCVQYIYSLCKLLEKILLGVEDMQKKIRKIVVTLKKISWILSYWIKNRRKHVYSFKNFSLILCFCGKTSYNIYPLNKFVSVQYSILDYMYNIVLHIPGIYLPCSVEIDVH